MAEHTPAPTPHRAIYGFAFFLLFKSIFFIYLFWAFVPDDILENHLGLTYLPHKYFALFIPALVLFALVFFAFLIYPAMNLSMTADVNNISTIRDNYTIKRCHYIDKNNNSFCDQKVTNANQNWTDEKYCIIHSLVTNQKDIHAGKGQNIKIENFCDCLDKEKCLLAKNPNHVHLLHNRQTVPSVSDLDISNVCRNMFRKTKKKLN